MRLGSALVLSFFLHIVVISLIMIRTDRNIPATPPPKVLTAMLAPPEAEIPGPAEKGGNGPGGPVPGTAPPEKSPPPGLEGAWEPGLSSPDAPVAGKDRPPGREPAAKRPLSGGKLFDPGIIGEIARSRQQSEEKKEEGEITFSTKDLKYFSYMMKLKDRIEGIWRYPPEALRRGIYGEPYIRFTIKKDGYLGSVELVRTSGYRELDEAALKAVRDGEPYWPLPESWGREGITITGRFIYSLYGVYVR